MKNELEIIRNEDDQLRKTKRELCEKFKRSYEEKEKHIKQINQLKYSLKSKEMTVQHQIN